MNDKLALQDLLEVQEHFGLPSPALVEKDWHVIRALAAIAAADIKPFRLVFGGGTALCRAHGLIRRMSEDIDLRIIAEKPTRSSLRALRETVTGALLGAGFVFDPKNELHRKSMHNNHYTIYRLPYDAAAEGRGALRPEIQIETAVFPLRRPAISRPLRSFIAEARGGEAELPAIDCADITETASEKLVALTRRAGAEFAGLRDHRDPTLVRHIYDLHATRAHYNAAEAAALAREIMAADAELRGDRFPAYSQDPLRETLKAIDAIAHDDAFATGYTTFCRDMVYGERPEFATAIKTLAAIAARLRAA